jgi:hypothetical protein
MAKKELKPNQFVLTREQIEKLTKLADHFKEVPQFTLVESFESGIGATVRVKFNLFDSKVSDTTVDITDVSDW